MNTFIIILISALVGFIIRPYVDALREYRIQKDKTECVYPQETDLPKRLMTISDFEEVLNYYLPNLWEMDIEYIDSLVHLTIKFKQPLLTKRIKLLQEYISEYKIICVFVNYK